MEFWPCAFRALGFRIHPPSTLVRIILARPMLSAMTDVKRGDGLLMSCSLASRTAAMIEAAITSVEANRSVMRLCSSIVLARSRSSRAMARFISPIFYRRSEARGGFICSFWKSRPRKMSTGKYLRFSPQSWLSATIHESGGVWTGAGIFC
jgi:hypothetical protein